MDGFFRRQLERLVAEGLENHSPWDYVERRLRSLAARQRATGLHGVPSEQDIDHFIRDCCDQYVVTSGWHQPEWE